MSERATYIVLVTSMVAFVIAAVIVMSPRVSAKMAHSEDFSDSPDKILAEEAKTAVTPQIRCESGMPCDNREQFERWYEDYCASAESDEAEETAVVEESQTVYSVNGESVSEDLQRYLYNQLSRYGKEWFFPIAVAQIYQESRWNTLAENPNGLDKGICQFRQSYFPAMAEESGLVEYDIFNGIDSIFVYAYTMSKYLDMTNDDVPMSLSLYYSGEGGQYSAQYVADVMQWMDTLKEIEHD